MAKPSVQIRQPIVVSSNQALFNHYLGQLKYYWETPEDKFSTYDAKYEAWKDARVGGARAELNARTELYNKLNTVNFKTYQKEQLAALRAAMRTVPSTAKRLALYNTIEKVKTAENWQQLGENFGMYHPIQTGRPEDYFTYMKHAADISADMQETQDLIYQLPQVRYTFEAAKQMVDARYNAMQSIAYAATRPQAVKSPRIFDTALQETIAGLKEFQEKYDNTWWKAYWAVGEKENYQENLHFQHIKTPALKVTGYTKAYEDALDALTQSPEWPHICAYQAALAQKQGRRALAKRWEQGDIATILSDARSKNLFKPQKATKLHNIGVTHVDTVQKKQLEEGLNKLALAEAQYDFFIARVNDYQAQAQSVTADLTAQPFHLDTRFAEHDVTVSNRIKDFADLMVQNAEVAPWAEWGVRATIDGAIGLGVTAVCAGSGGMLVPLVVGAGAGFGTDFGVSATGLYDWLGNPETHDWFTNTQNRHIVQRMQRSLEFEKKQAALAQSRLKQLDGADFDNALNYATQNAQNQNILLYVNQMRELEQLRKANDPRWKQWEQTHLNNLEQLKRAEEFMVKQDACYQDRLFRAMENAGMDVAVLKDKTAAAEQTDDYKAAVTAAEKFKATFPRPSNDELNRLAGKETPPVDLSVLEYKIHFLKDNCLYQGQKNGTYFYHAEVITRLDDAMTDEKAAQVGNACATEYAKYYSKETNKVILSLAHAMQSRVALEMEADTRETVMQQWHKAGRPTVPKAYSQFQQATVNQNAENTPTQINTHLKETLASASTQKSEQIPQRNEVQHTV